MTWLLLAAALEVVPAGGVRAQSLTGDSAAASAGTPRLAMPYACTVERGRVRVQPGPEQTYDIVDRIESQSFTICAPGRAVPCRTMSIHRFAVACSGGRVPWVEIAAAAATSRPRLHVELQDGRLLLGQSRPQPARYEPDCYGRLSGASARIRLYDPEVVDECWGPRQRNGTVASALVGTDSQKIALPQGFAPVGFVRARLLMPGRLPRPVNTARADPSTTEPGVDPPTAYVGTAREQRAGGGVVPASVAPLVSGSGWRTEILPADGPGRAPAADLSPAAAIVEEPSSWASTLLGLALVATIALLAVAAVAIRRHGFNGLRGRLARASGLTTGLVLPLPGGEARGAEALRLTASELLPVIRERLDTLAPALPLRQVLAREMHTAGQRLETLGREQPASAEQWRRVRLRLQTVVRDLQRLKDITDGAHSSLGVSTSANASGGAALATTEMPEPRDKAEAYATLGVNPGVDERILKKLVEALRQSWHPDLARDDADRGRREVRIKQINVAWDLIQGKRAEA